MLKKTNVFKQSSLVYENIPEKSPFKIMNYMIFALIPIYFVAFFYYGYRVLITGIFAVLTCFILDNICYLLRKKTRNHRDISPFITGMIINLLMPANISFSILFSACFIAICIAKHPFGGFGKNAFNPAAVGYCFATICWPKEVLSYPAPFSQIALDGSVKTKLVSCISENLTMNSIPNLEYSDILLGQFAGPIGATSIIILFSCALFLIIKKVINWKIPFVCIFTCAVFAFVFPRADLSQFKSVFFEITSGLIVFGSVFMACDPVNLPKSRTSQILYAFFLGVITMLFRYFGYYYFGFCFALIIVNALTSTLDVVTDYIVKIIGKAEDKSKNLSAAFSRKRKDFKFLKSKGDIIKSESKLIKKRNTNKGKRKSKFASKKKLNIIKHTSDKKADDEEGDNIE